MRHSTNRVSIDRDDLGYKLSCVLRIRFSPHPLFPFIEEGDSSPTHAGWLLRTATMRANTSELV